MHSSPSPRPLSLILLPALLWACEPTPTLAAKPEQTQTSQHQIVVEPTKEAPKKLPTQPEANDPMQLIDQIPELPEPSGEEPDTAPFPQEDERDVTQDWGC